MMCVFKAHNHLVFLYFWENNAIVIEDQLIRAHSVWLP